MAKAKNDDIITDDVSVSLLSAKLVTPAVLEQVQGRFRAALKAIDQATQLGEAVDLVGEYRALDLMVLTDVFARVSGRLFAYGNFISPQGPRVLIPGWELPPKEVVPPVRQTFLGLFSLPAPPVHIIGRTGRPYFNVRVREAPAPRNPGGRPEKFTNIAAVMQADMAAGRRTRIAIKEATLGKLARWYPGSQPTVGKARDLALKDEK